MISSFLHQTFADNALGFILTALAVAAVMAATVVILMGRAMVATGRARLAWGGLMAVVAGIGVWTTHFVAILGFRPDAVLAFSPTVTFASAAIGVVAIGGPLMASTHFRRPDTRAACGAVAGLGVGAMHFTGMGALDGCIITHDPAISVVAFGLGAAAFAAALALGDGRRNGLLAAMLIVIGVCALHFTALYGASVEALPDAGARGLDAPVLSAVVVFATFALCGTAAAAIYIQSRLDAQRRQAEDAQERQNAMFLLALRNMSNGLVMVDSTGRISALNPRTREILGLDENDAAVGMQIAAMIGAMAGRRDWSTEEVADFVADHARWLDTGGATRVERRFDNARTLSVVCRPLAEGGAVLTYDDVTEHRAAQDAMIHMAYHDPLTGLPNRRSFREEMQRLAAREQGVSVLMLDFDRFKWVNDTLGHTVGDALLSQAADRLRRACRPDDRIFRLGGDEFAVLARGGSEAQVRALAEALRACFEDAFPIEGHAVSVGCSIGYACAADGERRNLLEKADLALYRAKGLGRGRIESYEAGMMERAIERRQIEMDLSRAIAEREFQLHYQPLHALPSRRLLGFEALIRWRHPVRGLVSPADFIPISEANGMIVDIGAWVLEEACRQLAHWPDHLHVAINASAVQLRSQDFVGLVSDALTRHGIAPRRLEIELTETAMVEDGRQMSEVLKGLRRLGVRIAMDDFGTGYSSLAHLRDFELDRIKIDRSFVDTELDDVGSRAVIRAVTSLARDLSIVTIGEGVETPEQLQRLIDLGCDVAQGYHLGRPLDAGAAGRLIAVQMFDDDLAQEQQEATEARTAQPEDRKRA